ncbi:hypothetical protein [Streptosporangium sp. NPDC020145]|uniref:hypothetical protein n=1 Tax=Streptosporangium sp. NPDC020145 TaxID=3154694 RepID=UPI00341F0B73
MKKAIGLLGLLALLTLPLISPAGASGQDRERNDPPGTETFDAKLWSNFDLQGNSHLILQTEEKNCIEVSPPFTSKSAQNATNFVLGIYVESNCGGTSVEKVYPHSRANYTERSVKSVKFYVRSHVISMGDSYISGEGGRWIANPYGANNYRGTAPAAADLEIVDRAYRTNANAVYGNTWTYKLNGVEKPGCHRSDTAEIQWLKNTAMRNPFNDSATPTIKNIACSGATTSDMRNLFKGEQLTQIQDLESEVSENTNIVKYVVLSIGGNDLDVTGIVEQCVRHYFAPTLYPTTCQQYKAQKITQEKFATLKTNLKDIVKRIDTTLNQKANYGNFARIIVQGYPRPFPPAAAQVRPGVDGERDKRYGCPFHDADFATLESINKELNEKLDSWTGESGFWPQGRKGAFMNLRQAFDDHEACSNQTYVSKNTATYDGTTTGLPNSFNSPAARAKWEWVRFINEAKNSGEDENLKQESGHPNATGQRVLGDCLARVISKLENSTDSFKSYKCVKGVVTAS